MIISGLFGPTYAGSLIFLQRVPLTGTFSKINGNLTLPGLVTNEVISDIAQLKAFHDSLSPACIDTIVFDSINLHKILNLKSNPVRHPFGSYSRILYVDEIANSADCFEYPFNHRRQDKIPQCNYPICISELHSLTSGKMVDMGLQKLLPVFISPVIDDPESNIHLIFFWLSETDHHGNFDRYDMIVTIKQTDFIAAVNPNHN